MGKAKLLHEIAMLLQEKIGIKEGRSAEIGVKKDEMSIEIIDLDDKKFVITVKEVENCKKI